MRRLLLIICLFVALLALSLPVLLAQVAVTPEVESSEVLQPVNTPIVLPTTADAPAVEATVAPLSPFANEVLAILVPNRSDLELLAGQLMAGARPQGWSGSLDVSNPQLAVLLRLDLDLLMATLRGLDNIPLGWFGAIPSTPYAIARDIRHDLELLADAMLGLNVRPPGWTGADPLMRCDRSTQNLVQVLQRNGLFTPNILPGSPDYCGQLASQVGQFAEINLLSAHAVLLQPPAAIQSTSGETSSPASRSVSPGTHFAFEEFGLAFMNRYATRVVGNVPPTVPFTPVARSLTQFSHMTLVQGDNFEVFVDYKTTTIDSNTFNSLPDVNTYPANLFCAADWCQPEWRLPLFEIRSLGGGGRGLAATGLVNAGTNMIIHYDGDDHMGMTRVRMELCDRPTRTNQAICEPVTQVVLPDGTAAVPVGNIGGLLQFYAPYAYTTTSVRSDNFYTIDLWIDPPEYRR